MTEKALELHDAPSRDAALKSGDFVRELADKRPALAVLIAIAMIAVIVCCLGWTFNYVHLM